MSGASLDSPRRALLKSRLAYHHCLREDATDPDLTALERLMVARGQARRMRQREWEPEAVRGTGADRCAAKPQVGVVNGRRNLLDEGHNNG